MIPPFTVIIPARNEAFQLAKTAPALAQAVKDFSAQIIYVLNATSDDSACQIASAFGKSAEVVDTQRKGKTAALRAGDDRAKHDLRIYLDADVILTSETINTLLPPLVSGEADLVSPKIHIDVSASNGIARRVGRVWADQMSRREDGFLGCMAFNAAGVLQRGPWAEVLADDDWARSTIPPERRKIIKQASITMRPPRDVANWIKVRARWRRGTRELAKLGIPPNPTGMVKPRGSFLDLAAYYGVRLLAEPLAYVQHWTSSDWARDTSTRKHFDD